MKKLVASALVILALAFVPLVAGAHDDASDGGPISAPDGNTYYVDVDGPGVWQESNGDAGLQTAAHTHTDANGDPFTIAADTQLA